MREKAGRASAGVRMLGEVSASDGVVPMNFAGSEEIEVVVVMMTAVATVAVLTVDNDVNRSCRVSLVRRGRHGSLTTSLAMP